MASLTSTFVVTGQYLREEDISQKLQRSCTFSWGIYRRRDVVRHVGFVINFDEMPFCTVDFTVENINNPSCLVVCPSKVNIERVREDFKSHVDWVPPIQTLDTRREEGRERAKRIIGKLVTPSQEYYSLLSHNCRNNVKDVLNHVCNSEECNAANLEETKMMLLNTELQDNLFGLLVVQLVWVLGISLN